MTSTNNQGKKVNGLLSGGKFASPSLPGNVATPASSNPEHLPTGYLPSQAQSAPPQSGNGKPSSAGLLSGQAAPANQAPQKKGLLGGQAYTATPVQQSPSPMSAQNRGGPTQGPPMGPPPGGPGFQAPPGSQQRPGGPQGPQGPQQRPGGPQGPMAQALMGGKAAPTGPTGQIILYKTQHFYVRTTIHPNKRPSANPLRKPTGHTTMIPKIIPNQEQRVAESETRMMPALDVPDNAPRKKFYVPVWLESIVVALGLVAAVITHAYNMFNYPRYEMDEGTYMSAAWAITQGKLYPYAYGYGHPPFAWMQLAGFIQLLGGFFLFGNAINTGRVVMLFYTLGSTLLIYLIVRKMSDSRTTALLALAIFAFSPLAVDYQRLVLLDNFANFWLLLSIYLMGISKSRLPIVIAAAICFGLSFLSKEIFALFLPGMIYYVWLQSTKFQRKFTLVAFIYTFAAIASLWVLLAVLKGELFPQAWKFIPGNSHEHLSFLDTFFTQVGRGKSEGNVSNSLHDWFSIDPLLVALSVGSIVFNILVGWWRRRQLLFAILGASFWLLLIRGGVVFDFYYIPLIPFIAINGAFMINTLADWIGKFVRFDLLRAFLVLCALGGIAFFDVTHSYADYQGNDTIVQKETMAWIRANVPRNSYMVINAYLYMELKAQGGASVGDGATFPNAEVYINIATDPKLYSQTSGNWDVVDYIIADSPIKDYLKKSDALLPGAKYLSTALYHANICAKFNSGVGTNGYEIDIYCVQHQSPKPTALAPANGSPAGGHSPLLASGTTQMDRRSLMG